MLRNLKLILMLAVGLTTASAWANYPYQSNGYSQGGYYTGDYSQRGYNQCQNACTTCAGGPCSGPVECTQCAGGLVKVVRCMPNEVPAGQDFFVSLTATANAQCANVVITEHVPDGLVYVSSEPMATVDGNKLTWDIGDLQCGASRQVCVTYQAREEGCYCSCYTVNANPCCCQQLKVGCPKLQVTCCGPETVRLCCPANFHITVTNCGSMAAQQVTLLDEIAPEMQHSSCCNKLKWDLGTLCPGESRSVDLCLTAINCGKCLNTVPAQACGCAPVTHCCPTVVEHCCIKVTKTGPTGPIVVGKTADYTITATNTGNSNLSNVKITDIAPPGTRIKAAPGAETTGTRAIWTVPCFAAGETMTFNVTLTSCVPGCLCNVVQVQCNESCGDCAEACTQWVGVAGLWSCMKPNPNPICVDMVSTVSIQVQNQGFADDSNVKVVVVLPPELVPDMPEACGEYRVEGNSVVFDPIPVLQAGRTVNYSVRVKATQPGDARVKLQISSDLLTTPVVQEESINVY